MPDSGPAGDRPEDLPQPEPPRAGRRVRFRRWRRDFFGEPAATDFYGPAAVGPGRGASKEEWERFREELRNPPPPAPSVAPPGYRFVWYTDSGGMRHRSVIRDTDGPAPAPGDEPGTTG